MDDLTRLARNVGGQLEPQWTEEHIGTALGSVHAGVRRRRIRIRASAAAAMALVVGVAIFAPWSKTTDTMAVDLSASAPDLRLAGPLETAPLPAQQQQEFRFGDRAVVLPLMPNTELVAESVGSDLIEIRLVEGAARFNVNKRPGQSFRVNAGPIVIVVLGTEFIVRHADGYVEVSVSEGTVEVSFLDGTAIVGTGETRRFPREVLPPHAVTQNASNGASRTPQENTGPSRIIDDDGTELEPAAPAPQAAQLRSEAPPAGLLQQADMARLRQEYGLAAQILKRVLAAHPRPDTEVIAAFTLGRVLMDNLDRPVEAAHAFAKAHSADPDGNLAEDALAREVEAYWRAGRKDTAQVRAMEYMRLYPAGRRVRMVKRFSGSN